MLKDFGSSNTTRMVFTSRISNISSFCWPISLLNVRKMNSQGWRTNNLEKVRGSRIRIKATREEPWDIFLSDFFYKRNMLWNITYRKCILYSKELNCLDKSTTLSNLQNIGMMRWKNITEWSKSRVINSIPFPFPHPTIHMCV